MANDNAVLVATLALAFGALLGYVGITQMLEAGSFFTAAGETHNGILGIGGGTSQSASINMQAVVGLLIALVGASALLFGLRALWATFERPST